MFFFLFDNPLTYLLMLLEFPKSKILLIATSQTLLTSAGIPHCELKASKAPTVCATTKPVQQVVGGSADATGWPWGAYSP